MDGEMDYFFADLNVKAHYSLSEKDKVYLSYYTGKDEFSDGAITENDSLGTDGADIISSFSADTYALDWGNQILSARWNHLYSDKLFSNTTATYSNFQYTSKRTSEAEFSVLDTDFFAFRAQTSYSSIISDFSLRTDFDYFFNPEHHVRFGAAAIYRTFTPGLTESDVEGTNLDSIPDISENNFEENEALKTGELSLYVEDEFQKDNWTITGGFRLAVFNRKGKADVVPQPRMSVNYRFNPHLNFQTTGTYTAQFLHLLTRSDSGLPNDLWLPSDLNTPPQKSWQWSAALSGKIDERRFWKVEGYYKKMDDLIRLDRDLVDNAVSLDILQINVNNWENFVEKGEGKSYGIEASIEQQKGRLTGWIGYSFAKTYRDFQNNEQPYAFDSRHGFTIASNLQITGNLDLSLNWLWQSGRPLSTSEYGEQDVPFVNILQTTTTSQIAGRLPVYHRLDVGLNYHFSQKRWQHKIKIGLYNAYNRKNVFFAYDTFNVANGTPVTVFIYGLPLLPSFSYSLKF